MKVRTVSRVFTLALLTALLGSVALGGSALGSPVRSTTGVWGKPEPAPGVALLNKGGAADFAAISCPSVGNCVAGGSYTDKLTHTQAFVVEEKHGAWGNAITAPGTGALNTGGGARVDSIACWSAGNCLVGGAYEDASSSAQAYVVEEAKGVWGKAAELPGTAALNVTGNAYVEAVSCPTAGSCGLVGEYSDHDGNAQVFVDSEKNGKFRTAVQAPGLAKLNVGGDAFAGQVSCPSAGNCLAGGYYSDVLSQTEAFVIEEKNGVWGKAREVSGTAKLNAGGRADAQTVSCASPGSCSAGGYYADSSKRDQMFLVNETKGVWGQAATVPGTIALNAGGNGSLARVDCRVAGNCVAAGSYTDSKSRSQAVFVSEVNGKWGNALAVPGIGGSKALGAYADVLYCPASRNCVSGGNYSDATGRPQPFVINETNGKWGSPLPMPHLGALKAVSAQLLALSCPAVAECTAAGDYQDSKHHAQAFIVGETPR